jgi:aryl-alcohol dehydrogenase-like predicted oxidoreductase/enamine deaminase RidA (YjgF/YER057c/UK114 family)
MSNTTTIVVCAAVGAAASLAVLLAIRRRGLKNKDGSDKSLAELLAELPTVIRVTSSEAIAMSRAASSDALSVLEPSWSRTITKVSVELPSFVRAASSEALAMSRAASSEALARLEPGWSRITKVSEELEQLTSALWEFQRANVIEPARAAAAASGPALAAAASTARSRSLESYSASKRWMFDVDAASKRWVLDVQRRASAGSAARAILHAWRRFVEKATAVKAVALALFEVDKAAVMVRLTSLVERAAAAKVAALANVEVDRAVAMAMAMGRGAMGRITDTASLVHARVQVEMASARERMGYVEQGVPRRRLSSTLVISRMVTGLWQVADLEREGGAGLDVELAVRDLTLYREAGLCTFDMADHYGSAEVLAGRVACACAPGAVQCLTKWVPLPGREHATAATVDAAVATALSRLGSTAIDLLQLHTWEYTDGAWLDQLELLAKHPNVRNVGLCNFDADHARVALMSGVRVVTNQVSYSLLDRRAAGEMTSLCQSSGMQLLPFGVLAGGLLTDRYLDRADLTADELAASWSLAKYRRYVDCCGGWPKLQSLLRVLRAVADGHVLDGEPISIANVATRWVLEQPAVAAVIVGVRPSKSSLSNLEQNQRVFKFALSSADHAAIARALAELTALPGGCGDEYRKPPYLTASGDLTHHLSTIPSAFAVQPTPRGACVVSGTVWEALAGYSRAVRVDGGGGGAEGRRVVHVSGTTATRRNGRVAGGHDPAAQATFALDIVEASLKALGASMADVVRTRIFVRRMRDWEAVARVHGRRFDGVSAPANTLVQAGLVGDDNLVEIEAEAVVDVAGDGAAPSAPGVALMAIEAAATPVRLGRTAEEQRSEQRVDSARSEVGAMIEPEPSVLAPTTAPVVPVRAPTTAPTTTLGLSHAAELRAKRAALDKNEVEKAETAKAEMEKAEMAKAEAAKAEVADEVPVYPNTPSAQLLPDFASPNLEVAERLVAEALRRSDPTTRLALEPATTRLVLEPAGDAKPETAESIEKELADCIADARKALQAKVAAATAAAAEVAAATEAKRLAAQKAEEELAASVAAAAAEADRLAAEAAAAAEAMAEAAAAEKAAAEAAAAAEAMAEAAAAEKAAAEAAAAAEVAEKAAAEAEKAAAEAMAAAQAEAAAAQEAGANAEAAVKAALEAEAAEAAVAKVMQTPDRRPPPASPTAAEAAPEPTVAQPDMEPESVMEEAKEKKKKKKGKK